MNDFDVLTKQWDECTAEQANLWKSTDTQRMQRMVENLRKNLKKDQYTSELLSREWPSDWNLYQAQEIVQELSELGKEMKHQQELQQTQQTHARQKLQELQERLEKNQQALTNFQTQADEKVAILHEKLKDCPCAKELLQDDSLNSYEDHRLGLEKNTTEAKHALEEFMIQNKKDESEIDFSHTIETITKALLESDRKELRERTTKSQALQERLKSLQTQRDRFEREIQRKLELQQSVLSFQDQLLSLRQE